MQLNSRARNMVLLIFIRVAQFYPNPKHGCALAPRVGLHKCLCRVLVEIKMFLLFYICFICTAITLCLFLCNYDAIAWLKVKFFLEFKYSNLSTMAQVVFIKVATLCPMILRKDALAVVLVKSHNRFCKNFLWLLKILGNAMWYFWLLSG
jgi:hypothetical protein